MKIRLKIALTFNAEDIIAEIDAANSEEAALKLKDTIIAMVKEIMPEIPAKVVTEVVYG